MTVPYFSKMMWARPSVPLVRHRAPRAACRAQLLPLFQLHFREQRHRCQTKAGRALPQAQTLDKGDAKRNGCMEIESFFLELWSLCCLSGPLNMNGCHACGLHAPSINSIEWTRPMPRMTLGTKTHVRHLATLILQKALRCQKSACSTPISGHGG